MIRDSLIAPFDQKMDIVIACDNSGSIGMKTADDVSAPYDVVSYFAFRVAYMECMAAGGIPFSVIIQNFNDKSAWNSLLTGIKRGCNELAIDPLPITGSTESNFSLAQSATGITVLGKRLRKAAHSPAIEQVLSAAVIGSPLIGNEVIEQKENIAPLALFQWFCKQHTVLTVVPVGSKGILHELRQLFPDQSLDFTCDLRMEKSSGPSTCFIAVYAESDHRIITSKAGRLFHNVNVNGGSFTSSELKIDR
ncbi:ATP-binding protein [Virgibacillus phasianinus]|uniref:ATP-binding protein n=2 Tax=Virgibacillus phasianinus TaxID=2017483 RepID=A0A220U151_9BACI|nr:ATP-binding protein [Virgibacillus phasianinus]